jgi:enamine deaminase RidA (YjgF/YER057c/UK114 family)
MLATLKRELGSLDKVCRIVKVNGVVNATPNFLQHTHVINGASDLLVEIFGQAGEHARLAVGYASLPWNICVEVELIAEVEE